jgi:hypothetical protein
MAAVMTLVAVTFECAEMALVLSCFDSSFQVDGPQKRGFNCLFSPAAPGSHLSQVL